MTTDYAHVSDEALVGAIAERNCHAAFEELRRRYLAKAVAIARRRLTWRGKNDDVMVHAVVNFAFFRLYQAIRNGTFLVTSPVSPYLSKIIVRAAFDVHRIEQKVPETLENLFEPACIDSGSHAGNPCESTSKGEQSSEESCPKSDQGREKTVEDIAADEEVVESFEDELENVAVASPEFAELPSLHRVTLFLRHRRHWKPPEIAEFLNLHFVTDAGDSQSDRRKRVKPFDIDGFETEVKEYLKDRKGDDRSFLVEDVYAIVRAAKDRLKRALKNREPRVIPGDVGKDVA